MFKGSITALITPFRDGQIDEKSMQDFLEWQILEGSHGFVPVGTTGESPTLTHAEHKRVVEQCVQVVNRRIPVIAGAGSNNTKEALEFAKHAEECGADAVLVVTPYYNKPSQEGLYRHYKAISEAIHIPIIIYNIPSRSVIDMSVATMTRLFNDCHNIIGVKDATADLTRISDQRLVMGDKFVQLSGDDPTALGFMAQGGHGCISVTSNVAPRLCASFQEACMTGDFAKALSIHDRLMPLHRALFMEPSPGGAKFALSLLGKCQNELRSPLTEVSSSTQTSIRQAMQHAGLLE